MNASLLYFVLLAVASRDVHVTKRKCKYEVLCELANSFKLIRQFLL